MFTTLLALPIHVMPFAVQGEVITDAPDEASPDRVGEVHPVAATIMFWPPFDIARALTGFGVYAVKLTNHSENSAGVLPDDENVVRKMHRKYVYAVVVYGG